MSDDLIKRSDAIKAVNKAKAEGMVECPTYYIGLIPSADRPQEWIPCSERLPKASITAPCLMTIVFPRAHDVGVTYGYRYHEDVWEYATFEGYEYTEKGIAEVLAWMPLPKPWKGKSDEQTN